MTIPRRCGGTLRSHAAAAMLSSLAVLSLLVAVPEVVLSTEHQAMCRVGVGDAFPAIAARDAAGTATEVTANLGERATVIAAPGGPAWMDAALRADLAGAVAAGNAERGVAVLTLGGPPAEAAEGVTALSADPKAVASSLGEGRAPRVYVVDAAGKIVWFDLEYSLATRRELLSTLDELTSE